MAIPIRVSALLGLILAFALILTAALGYAKFQKALAGVILARQQVTTHSLADSIETGLNLGLSLAEIQNFKTLVERAAHEHPDLLLAEVVDSTGRQVFLYQSGETAPQRSWTGQPVPAAGWSRFGPHTIAIAETLDNSFGQRVGVLVLEFSRTAFDTTLADISHFTINLLLAVTGVGISLCALLGALLHRPLERSLERVERELDGATAAASSNIPSSGVVHVRAIATSVENDIRAISERLHHDRS
jgi:hypothetical protein